jgi:hypothetical protein
MLSISSEVVSYSWKNCVVKLTRVLINFRKYLIMEKWLRSGTLKRKANDTGDANPSCDMRVAKASKCDRSTIKVEEASRSKEKYSRKYDSSYLELGFTWCGDDSEQKAQCVLCYEVLSNERMKPAKLRRHLENKHCDVKNKPTEFFQRRLGTLNYGKDIVSALGSINSKALEASYLLSLRIAKTGKPHSIGENLLLPAIKDVVKLCMATSY